MKKNLFLVFFVLMFAALAYGGQIKKIELMDGSSLEGEIVAFSDGKYTVKSPSLGTLQVEDSKIRTIGKADAAVGDSEKDITSLNATAIQNEAQKVQSKITGNPEIMKSIPALISSPDFQALLKDPELMKAAKSMDLKALMANQNFVNVVNDPAVQEVRKKVYEKKQD